MRFHHELLLFFFIFFLFGGFICGNASGKIIELCPNPYGSEGAEYIKADCSGDCYLTDGEGRIELNGSFTAAKNPSAYSSAFGSPPDTEFSSRFALANSGETVSLFKDDELIDSFTYGEDIDFLDEGVIYFRNDDGWDFRYQDWSDFESIEDNVSGKIIISPATYAVEANKEVELASYTLTSYQFSELEKEGVEVEVFLDATPVGGIPLEEYEATRGLDTHFLESESLRNFHYKFAVIDNHKVVLTTENWNWDKRGYIVEVNSGKAADFFHKVLEHDIKYEEDKGKTGDIEGGSSDENYSKSDRQFNFDGRVRFFVLPDSNPIFNHISGASDRVYIQVPYMDFKWFNGTPLLNSILSAAEKGAEVKILFDSKYNKDDNQKTAGFLNELAEKRDLNIEAKLMEHTPLHAKMVVADDHTLITSANFNRYGLKLNREAGVIIYDKEATGFVAQQFKKDWKGDQEINANFVIPAILILSASIIVTYRALKK